MVPAANIDPTIRPLQDLLTTTARPDHNSVASYRIPFPVPASTPPPQREERWLLDTTPDAFLMIGKGEVRKIEAMKTIPVVTLQGKTPGPPDSICGF